MDMLTSLACLALLFPSPFLEEEPIPPRGVARVHQELMAPGYTLISPFDLNETFIIDHEGTVVHKWETQFEPGLSAYLLPNGNLLRGIQIETPTLFQGGGISGGIQEYSWDGELLWEFHISNDRYFHHHDFEPLPNGNVLMIAWEYKSPEEAKQAGRNPEQIHDKGLWPEVILEVEPLRPHGARVVWEWHVWDHLIQDYDESLPNYGDPAENPGRLNINGDLPPQILDDEKAQLAALGYIVGDDDQGDDDDDKAKDDKPKKRADWLHFNAVDYNAELDQIAMSSFYLSEILIIDHGTTLEEARSSSGGRRGRGGDFLYRWGNPQNWNAGDKSDRLLFFQHDIQWVPKGYPGEGNLTVFNNGRERPEEEYTTVLEIAPPLKLDGTYAREDGEAYGPEEPEWAYDPKDKEARFFASFISGAHRLENGNTLICSGPQGRLLEVTRLGEVVWEYYSPYAEPPEDSSRIREGLYSMFRATRIPMNHPALKDKTLAELSPQPKSLERLLAENHPPPPSPWKSLGDLEAHWVPVNCADTTFKTSPNPDDQNEKIIVCTGKPTGIIRSNEMYENFVVELEWRHMEEPSNAGFFIWADPLPAIGGPFTRGIEVQICNLGNGDWFTSHGDIFPIWGAVMTPDPRFRISGDRSMPNEDSFHVRPTAMWNHYRITAIDGAITLEVNGELVAAGSHCNPKKGYLCLESEGGEVHFRNLRLWELPKGSSPADHLAIARSAEPITKGLYNGLDLDGWEILHGSWTSADWRLMSDGSPAEIRIQLPDDVEGGFLDFKRDSSSVDTLPIRIGDKMLPFAIAGQEVGKWNRVHFRIDEREFIVSMGTEEIRFPTEGSQHPYSLTLSDHGVPTEFCSIFAKTKEPKPSEEKKSGD